jgi:gliding motility-associated-like protein
MMALSNYVPCRDTAYATIEVDSISAIRIAASDTVFCNGLSSTFTGMFTTLGNTGYTWDLGDGHDIDNVNPLTHSYEHEGVYTVNLHAFYRACPDTNATQKIVVFDHPGISLGPDTAICPGGTVIFLEDQLNADNPKARWRWSTGEVGPKLGVVAPGIYGVTVTVDGCSGSDTVIVRQDCYMALPNVFSPNGDGVNDYFFPRPLLAKGLATFKMDIYNRWGQLIFTTNKTEGSGWDGKFNDVVQPEGVYVYVIDATFVDGQKERHQGNVTLIR